jgi:hypothetical protein
MKTLIITVGTRQVGWRCTDGIVRSLGADGGAFPPHINELYTLELEQERGYHPDHQSWSVRHLGEQFYSLCELKQTFSPVELLIDNSLIAQEVKDGLTQVVLWGTDQPEDLPWKFRRFDTLWLANLMAGKLRQLYPLLQVEVWNPVIAANNPILLCQSVETYILNEVFDAVPEAERKDFTLLIENKGSVPLIANALEMCAVALSRQCHVKLIIPTEPDSLFIALDNGYQTVQCSTHCSYLPIGKYFWPLEKPKIISAWQRGDFGEAQLWLSAHRDRYKPLCDLAGYLTLATNGDVRMAVKQIKNQWGLNGNKIKRLTTPEEHQRWLALTEKLEEKNQSLHHKYAWIWERIFLFEIEIQKHFNSNSFLSFVQTLEALLNLQCESEEWVKRGYIESGREYSPSLGTLIKGWEQKHSISEDCPWHFCLDQIRQKRNKVAHEGTALTLNEIDKILSVVSVTSARKPTPREVTANTIIEQMRFVLETVAHPASKLPQDILLRSLYKWGLDSLETEQ